MFGFGRKEEPKTDELTMPMDEQGEPVVDYGTPSATAVTCPICLGAIGGLAEELCDYHRYIDPNTVFPENYWRGTL